MCDWGDRFGGGRALDSGGTLYMVAHSDGRAPHRAHGRVVNAVQGQGVDVPSDKTRRVKLDVKTPGESLRSSARLIEVGLRFGVPLAVPGFTIAAGLELELAPGTITLITGASGTGKSLLLGEIARRFPTSRLVENVQFPQDVAVVDAVSPTRPVIEALGTLTACGLGEPMLWIRRFEHLSAGEQFRARLARAISLQRRSGGSTPLLCDEFGAILHRRLAKAMAFNLRKLVSRDGLTLVVATSQDDLERDLSADTVVRLGGPVPVVEHAAASGTRAGGCISFARRLRIERGTLRDYAGFSAMHYRHEGNLGFIDKVFVCRDGLGGEPLGAVVYGRPVLELALRNQTTCRRFVRQAKRLNREMRVLKRLVIHPDVRGCGLGHWLVQRTLPLAETRFVECLAAMGMVNPVFERAGMRRIGTCAAPVSLQDTVVQLRSAGADPLAADFVSQICRRPGIRRLVSDAVGKWYRASTRPGKDERIQESPTRLAQTFRQVAGSQPIYYIWAKDEAGWALIDRGQSQNGPAEGPAVA